MRLSRTFVTGAAVLAALGGVIAYAQEKYGLVSPGGIAFADFRGYEDWAVVSSARTDEVQKVIVGNPTMIKAFKAGVPCDGKSFPEGSAKRAGSITIELPSSHAIFLTYPRAVAALIEKAARAAE